MTGRPCSAVTAVARARSLVVDPTNKTTGYVFGAGDFHDAPPDLPWSPGSARYGQAGVLGADCAGFVS